MTGWLIYDQAQYARNEWFAGELLRHCAAFSDMRLLLSEKLCFGVFGGKPAVRCEDEVLTLPDFVLCRTIYPLLSQFLEQNGCRVFNRAAISLVCNDKRQSYLLAAKAGVPVLDTVFADRRFLSPELLARTAFPCVVKSAAGHGGKEVFLLHDAAAASACIAAMPSDSFLLQELCRTQGKDLRVYVLRGQILGAVLRSAPGFKSNYSLGGSATLYRLNAAETALVQRLLDALPCPADFIGVDFLLDAGRLIFNEFEDVVGSRMLYEAAGMDVAGAVAAAVKAVL